MSDIVTYGADATQYFDVVNRMNSAATRFGSTVNTSMSHGADGTLRSERIVSRSMGNMVQNLFQAQDAATAVSQALLSVERSGKLGFGFAIGAAVGIAGFEAIAASLQKIRLADEALQKASAHPLNLVGDLSPSEIGKEIDGLSAAMTGKITSDKSFSKALVNTYLGAFEDIKDIFSGGFSGGKGIFGHVDKDADEVQAAQERLNKLGYARAQAELDVAAAKEVSFHKSEEEGAILKINADFASKRAMAIFDAGKEGGTAAGIDDRIQALQREKDLAIEEVQTKAKIKDIELAGAGEVAAFQGTKTARAQLTLDVALKTAMAEKQIADAVGNQTKEKEAQIAVDKALQALADHKLEVAKQDIELGFGKTESDSKVKAAKAQIGAGPERSQEISLESQLELSKQLTKKAQEKLSLDKDDKNAQLELVKAKGNQLVSAAQLAKFEDEQHFKHQQEMNQAKGETRVAKLKATGDKFGTDILANRVKLEAQIAQDLRNQNVDLAKQHALTGDINAISNLAHERERQAKLTPEQRQAESQQKQHEAQLYQEEQNRLQAWVDHLQGKGIIGELPTLTPEEADQVNSMLNEQSQIASAEKKGTSLTDLQNADFSNLQNLSDMDFSGLQPLSGLTITVQ